MTEAKPTEIKLPPWAKVEPSEDPRYSIVIAADTAGAMSTWLTLLQVDPERIDQYWLECAYQCAKMDLQLAIDGTPHDPRTCAKSHLFKFSRSDKFAQVHYPKGRGAVAASKGHEARSHFKRIRGRLPF